MASELESESILREAAAGGRSYRRLPGAPPLFHLFRESPAVVQLGPPCGCVLTSVSFWAGLQL